MTKIEHILENGWTVQSLTFSGLRARLIKMTEVEHAAERTGLEAPFHQIPLPDAEARLARLTDRVHHDLNTLLYPREHWVLPRTGPDGEHVYEVVIVGAGQCGLSVGHGLLQEKVDNFLILDRSPVGNEGPWVTYSRMWTLRSPKHVGGPELGMPSLAGRSWFEAIYGEKGWQSLDKWPRQLWQSYLDWFRAALNLPVRNDAEVSGFAMEGKFVRVTLASGDTVLTRKVVLATGLEGMGGWRVPAFVREKLPESAYTLCTDDVDSLDWKGQNVAVLGAGATGWDRAADLLELGAAGVTIYMRRPEVLAANAFRNLEKSGYLRHFASMSDTEKWRWIQKIFTFGQPPTQDGVDRCAFFPHFTLHSGATWTDVNVMDDGQIEVIGSDGSRAVFDHLFIGCGFSVNAHNRPELRPFADNILLWRDVHAPPDDAPDTWLMGYPYLTPGLLFQKRDPARTPVLDHIYCFNYGATVSNAHSGGSLSGLRYGLPPLIHGVTHALWMEDEPFHFAVTRDWDRVDTDASALAGQTVNAARAAREPQQS